MQLVSSFLKPGSVVNFEFSLVKILNHPKKEEKEAPAQYLRDPKGISC